MRKAAHAQPGMRKAAHAQPGMRKAAQRQHAESGAAPHAERGSAAPRARSAARGARSAEPQHAEPRARAAGQRRLKHRSSHNSLRYHPATAPAWDRWAMIRFRVNLPAYSAGKFTEIGIMGMAAAAKRGWGVRPNWPGTGAGLTGRIGQAVLDDLLPPRRPAAPPLRRPAAPGSASARFKSPLSRWNEADLYRRAQHPGHRPDRHGPEDGDLIRDTPRPAIDRHARPLTTRHWG